MTFSSEDKATLETEVARAFSSLAASGFVQTAVQVKHGALGDLLETTLVNDALNRRVRIHLLRADQRENVAVFVERIDKGTFLIDTFLKWKGASSERLKQCDLSTYSGSLAERLSGCLSFSNTVLEKDLSSVLRGASWPDVPIDWGDYR